MRLRSLALLGLISLALAVLIALGVWQLQRNDWKQDLVAKSDARTDEAPLTITDASDLDPESMDYRRVVIEGEWRLEDTMLLANRIRNGQRGQEIVVPAQPAGGGPAVLVNLGWVPDGIAEAEREALVTAATPKAGLARDISGRDARQIPSGAWTGLSPEDMGAALGYPVAEWYVIAGEERAPGAGLGDTLPVQGWQRFVNTTPHIEYALTWFGIAAVLVVIAVARLIVAPRRTRAAQRQADR